MEYESSDDFHESRHGDSLANEFLLHEAKRPIILHSENVTADEAIGYRIEEWRLEHGKTREELAERLGLELRHLERIEKGEDQIGLYELVDLVNYFERTMKDFFASEIFKRKFRD